MFSEEVVRKAVEGWLRDGRYEFEVRIIPFEQARGVGGCGGEAAHRTKQRTHTN